MIRLRDAIDKMLENQKKKARKNNKVVPLTPGIEMVEPADTNTDNT